MLERLINKSLYDWGSPSHDKCIIYGLPMMHHVLSALGRENQIRNFTIIIRYIKNNI